MSYARQWDFLKGKLAAGQLSHAYLLSGSSVSGVLAFAKEFAKMQQCLNRRTGQWCGDRGGQECRYCRLVQNEQFPDLHVIASRNSKRSQKDGQDAMEIDISQVREAQEFLSYTPYYGGGKTVIVEHADRMNTEAQDCFLKNLEEPRGNALILLVSGKPETLLPTLVSRCQAISFVSPESYPVLEEHRQVLNPFLGVVGASLAEKFRYLKSANIDAAGIGNWLEAVRRYFRNVLLQKLGVLSGTDMVPKTPDAVRQYSVDKTKKILDAIEVTSRQVLQTNANPKLALEILLMEI